MPRAWLPAPAGRCLESSQRRPREVPPISCKDTRACWFTAVKFQRPTSDSSIRSAASAISIVKPVRLSLHSPGAAWLAPRYQRGHDICYSRSCSIQLSWRVSAKSGRYKMIRFRFATRTHVELIDPGRRGEASCDCQVRIGNARRSGWPSSQF